MSQGRTFLAPRRKPYRKVAFSDAKPSVRIIPAEYTSWPNGETSKSPPEYDVINARTLTKQALDAAAAEEKRDRERARTGRRPSAMQDRQREDVFRARAKSSAAILAAQERISSRSRYDSQARNPAVITKPSTNSNANASSSSFASRPHRKPVPGSRTPMQNPDLNRSAPDVRSPEQGIARARSSSNVEAPLREPARHVGNLQSREKIEMKVVGGFRMAKGFAKKVAGQAVDRFDARYSQNG